MYVRRTIISSNEFQSNIGNSLGRLYPGALMECDDPRAIYYQPLGHTNFVYGSPVYQQPTGRIPILYDYGQPAPVPVKAEPEVRENAAIRFIKQIAIQDKSNHPQGSKIPSEEKLLTAVDLCHF